MAKRDKNRKVDREQEEDNSYQSGNKIKSPENSDEDSIDKTQRKFQKEQRDNPKHKKKLDNSSLEGKNEDELLKALFGVEDFDSTKNKSHVDSDLSGVFKGSQRKRKYRQYMNRSGGHNKGHD